MSVPVAAATGAFGLDPVRGGVGAVGGDFAAHPQADAEGHCSPCLFVLAAEYLAGADEGGGALELLDGEQPQCVAHEDGHPGVSAERTDRALKAADGERVGGEAKVGLGFAATGREPQQVSDTVVVVGPFGVGRVGE